MLARKECPGGTFRGDMLLPPERRRERRMRNRCCEWQWWAARLGALGGSRPRDINRCARLPATVPLLTSPWWGRELSCEFVLTTSKWCKRVQLDLARNRS